MDDRPMVSVLVMTFNRSGLIAKALDAILAQKTDFVIEIVVGDNASTDGTQGVLNDYQKRFADTIRLRLSDINEGCCVNFAKTHDLCRGKYIAICDSDDYWIDPYKLARQVAFLEANPDYNWMSTSCLGFANDRLVRLDALRFSSSGFSVATLEEILQSTTDPKIALSKLPHVSTWLFRNTVCLYKAWYAYPARYPYDAILAFMLEAGGKHYHDGLSFSTVMSYQDNGWSAHHATSEMATQKGHTHLVADWLGIFDDLKKSLGKQSESLLDQRGERLLWYLFRRLRRDCLHMRWQAWPYLIQIACYIGDDVLAKYSQKGKWGQVFYRYCMKGLRCLAKKQPPLFPSLPMLSSDTKQH